MSRRKQCHPMKRSLLSEDEDEKQEQPKNKITVVEKTATVPTTSALPSISGSLPSFSSTRNPLSMLEQSLKKYQPATVSHKVNPQWISSKNINELMKVVDKIRPIGGMNQSSSTSSSGSHDDDKMCSIFKCLQCSKGFENMELLVKHMTETKHFSNINMTLGNSSLSVSKPPKFYQAKPEYPRSLNCKLKCKLCQQSPVNIDEHLRESHGITTSAEWLKSVELIHPQNMETKSLLSSSPHLSHLMSLINTVKQK